MRSCLFEIAERRAQCWAKDRPVGMGSSMFGDIAVLLGGRASTADPSSLRSANNVKKMSGA